MDVLNDRRKETAPEVDLFQVLTLALFAGAGFSTFFLAPLAILVAEWRLPPPFPKVAALGGALVAALVLAAPVPWVAVAFVLSILFSHLLKQTLQLWSSLAVAVATAMVVALGLLFFNAALRGVPPLPFWNAFISQLMVEVKSAFDSGVGVDWATVETLFRLQAPFLLTAVCLVSAWISVGMGAHFGWLGPEKAVDGNFLRKAARLPFGFSMAASLLVAFSLAIPLPYWAVGITRIFGCLLFIQGSACLSDILLRRKVSRAARSWVYVISVVFGFYALLALGMISPWYFRAARLAARAADFEERTT